MTDHDQHIYYCHSYDGRTVIASQLPDDFESLTNARIVSSPTAEVATMIFETDLKLRGYWDEKTIK